MPPEFHRPTTIEDAVSLLGTIEGARPLAGGQTLVAMMNSNLIEPPALVSLRRIDSLRGIDITPEGIRIGAMTPHAVVEKDARLSGAWSVLPQAAAQIAHPAIRGFGTMGGAVAHGDPNSDYPTALTAANAVVEVRSSAGRRQIPAGQFFLDYLTTALEPGELVTAVHVPPANGTAVGVYEKFARVDGDYATVAVALVVAFERGVCRAARIAVGSCGPTPLHRSESDQALVGSTLDDSVLARAGELLVETADPVDDVRGSADLRRRLIPRLLWRAAQRARRASGA